MSDAETPGADSWARQEQLAAALAGGDSRDPAQLGEAFGLAATEVDDVARALSALGAATELDAPLPAAPPAGEGERVGDYELLERIGRGAFGVVYRARDPVLEVDVALKLLAVAPEAEAELGERFAQEARAAARLDHPHVVRVRAAGWDPRGPYLVMDLVQGESLQRRLEREGPLPVALAVRLARQLAEALAHAHAQGVLHRDVKPDNVLVTPDDAVRLTDFGLARDALATGESKVSRSGHALGTPGYWPPEQARGELEAIGPASDVYGLGATLYALLTGRAPYTGPHTLAILEAMARGAEVPPPSRQRPDVGPALDAICARCLAPDPAGRYASAADLSAALAAWQPEAPGRAREPRGRLAGAVLLTLGLGLAWVALSEARPPRRSALPPPTPAGSAAPVRSEVAPVASRNAPDPPPSWSTLDAVWRERPGGSPRPGAWGAATLVGDPRGDGLLLFGGLGRRAASKELWRWDGGRWQRVPHRLPWPSPRYAAAGVLDTGRGRMVLFGGRDSEKEWLADLWEWDGRSWRTARLPEEDRPRVLSAAYDPQRRRSLVLLDKRLWAWDGHSWKQQPKPPVNGRALVWLGGRGLLLGPEGRFWEFDGAQWRGATDPLPGGTPKSVWLTVADDAVLLVGARKTLRRKQRARFETWLFHDGRWRSLAAGSPDLRALVGLGWLPVQRRAVFLGGAHRKEQQLCRSWWLEPR